MALLALGRGDRAYLLAGLFVLAGILLLGAWLVAKVFGQSLQGYDYYAFLTDVTGVRVGTPVMVAGYRIGQVKGVEFGGGAGRREGESRDSETPGPMGCRRLGRDAGPGEGQRVFRLRLATEKGWPLTVDSRVRLEKPNLLGQPVIAVELGKESPLCSGSALPYEPRPDAAAPDIALLTQKAGQVLGVAEALLRQVRDEKLPAQASRLLAEAQNAAADLGQAAKTMNGLISDPKLGMMKAEAERAAGQLNALLAEARQLAREARALTPAVVGAVDELRPPLGNAAVSLDQALRLTATRLPGILTDLERSAQDLSGLVADLRTNPPAALRGRADEVPVWSGEPRR